MPFYMVRKAFECVVEAKTLDDAYRISQDIDAELRDEYNVTDLRGAICPMEPTTPIRRDPPDG